MKQIVQWMMAIAIGTLIVNIFLATIYANPGFVKRDGGATPIVYEPGARKVRFDEGFGVSHYDEKGHTNDTANVSDDYVLILGNSYTEAEQVMQDKRYAHLLDDSLQDLNTNPGKAMVYTFVEGGASIGVLTKRIQAAMTEMGKPSVLVMQILDSSIPTQGEVESAYSQRVYQEEYDTTFLFQHISAKQRIKNLVKDYIPLVPYVQEEVLYNWQHKGEDKVRSVEIVEDGVTVDGNMSDRECLEKTLGLMRQLTDVPIIILDVSYGELTEDGSFECREGNSYLYRELCQHYDQVYYLSMKDKFEEHYRSTNEVPFGFANTKPSGHANTVGQRLIAEVLSEKIHEIW